LLPLELKECLANVMRAESTLSSNMLEDHLTCGCLCTTAPDDNERVDGPYMLSSCASASVVTVINAWEKLESKVCVVDDSCN
jgi:hypothetical protein